MSTIRCPACEVTLQFPPFADGQPVRCPKCQHVFVGAAPGENPARPDRDGASTGPDGRVAERAGDRADAHRDGDALGGDVHDGNRDRNGDRKDGWPDGRRADDDDARSLACPPDGRERARRLLAGPGLGLLVCGVLGLACPAFLFLRLLIARPPQQNRLLGLLIVFVPLIWSICLIVGASAIRSTPSKGIVIFGCAVSLLPCNIVWPLSLAMGIWALVVFFRPEVNEAVR